MGKLITAPKFGRCSFIGEWIGHGVFRERYAPLGWRPPGSVRLGPAQPLVQTI